MSFEFFRFGLSGISLIWQFCRGWVMAVVERLC